MRIFTPARSHVVAVLVALTAALVARSWLQVTFRDSGLDRQYAADLSYLVVPPILILFLVPVLRKDWQFLRNLLKRNSVSFQLILVAIAIGLLFRVAWWSQLTARISFGFQSSVDPNAIEGPVFQYQCPSFALVFLGITVGVVLIPPIEEIIHRGYVQTLFHKYGVTISVALSALIFMIFHRSSGWQFAFAGGVVLGTMYWFSGSLWPSIVTHGVVNLTPQLTWRCMSLQWNPAADSLPLLGPGIAATAVFAISTGTMIWLVFAKCRRRDK